MHVIQLSPDYRIRPLDHLQWVLEKRRPVSRFKGGGERWDAFAYCHTRVGLETALSRLRCGGVHLDPKLIAHLPERFPEPAVSTSDAVTQTPAAEKKPRTLASGLATLVNR
jgi:hypothetical protein